MNLSILKTVGFGVGALLGVTVVFYASRAGYRRWFSKLDVVGRNQISENKKKFTAPIATMIPATMPSLAAMGSFTMLLIISSMPYPAA